MMTSTWKRQVGPDGVARLVAVWCPCWNSASARRRALGRLREPEAVVDLAA